MTKNRFSSRRTRHMDVKHHIVRDAIDGGIVHVEYVRSGEQHADILTKTLDRCEDLRKTREIPSELFVIDSEEVL